MDPLWIVDQCLEHPGKRCGQGSQQINRNKRILVCNGLTRESTPESHQGARRQSWDFTPAVPLCRGHIAAPFDDFKSRFSPPHALTLLKLELPQHTSRIFTVFWLALGYRNGRWRTETHADL